MWFVLANATLSWKDRTLTMRASQIETLLNSLPERRSDVIVPRLDELLGIMPEGQLVQILAKDGARLFPLDVPQLAPDLPHATCPTAWIQNTSVKKGTYRRLCRPVSYQGQPAYLMVTSSLVEDRILLDSFTAGLYKMVPLLLLVSGLGGYALSRRALRPVDLLIAEARTITASDLSRRLAVPQADDELRHLATEWNALLSRIEVELNRVTQFTADASHELRSPIAYIRTTAEYSLHSPHLDVETRQGLEEIVRETKSTTELLEDLLTLARADAGSIQMEVEEVDLHAVVADVCTRLAPAASAKQQCIKWKPVRPEYIGLSIDLSHLRRLLTILIDNAIKYTPDFGAVDVTCESNDGVCIRVCDTGYGISEQHLSKVFDRFYRVDCARTDRSDGVGLGLSIAKWLTELHHGSIEIESEVDRGTNVTVRFRRSVRGLTSSAFETSG